MAAQQLLQQLGTADPMARRVRGAAAAQLAMFLQTVLCSDMYEVPCLTQQQSVASSFAALCHSIASSLAVLTPVMQEMAERIVPLLLDDGGMPKCEPSQVASVVDQISTALCPLLDAAGQQQTWMQPEHLGRTLDACSTLLHCLSRHLFTRHSRPLVQAYTDSLISSIKASGVLSMLRGGERGSNKASIQLMLGARHTQAASEPLKTVRVG